ncbi:MAG: response regulator [Planctomycetota bacterium]
MKPTTEPKLLPMKVLITDDSKVTRSVLRKIMQELSFEVVEATNGAEAIGMLTRDLVDLCLVDWNMPTMNGVEFITHLRANPTWSKIPAVLVTDETARERLDSAFAAGASGYLAKPFKTEELRLLLLELGLDIGLQ